ILARRVPGSCVSYFARGSVSPEPTFGPPYSHHSTSGLPALDVQVPPFSSLRRYAEHREPNPAHVHIPIGRILHSAPTTRRTRSDHRSRRGSGFGRRAS